MSETTAKYILSAEDRTQAAIDSAKRSFKSLDEGVRAGVKSLNLMSDLFIGGKLLSGFRNLTSSVLEATKASDSGFAESLDKMHASVRNLLTAKEGLPAAKQAIDDLTQTLSDPTTIAAADSIASKLIRGFAAAAKYTGQIVAGLGLILNGPSQKSMQIDDQARGMQDERKRLLQSAGVDDPSKLARRADYAQTYNRILEIDRQLPILIKAASDARDAEAKADRDAAAAAAALAAEKQRLIDINVHHIRATYDLKVAMKELEDNMKWLEGGSIADSMRTAGDAVQGLAESTHEALSKLAAEGMDDVAREVEDEDKRRIKNLKGEIGELSEWSKEAARSTFNAFSDFFFDPFENGLRGLASGLLGAFRRVLADRAAQQVMDVFTSFGSGGSREGTGGFIGSMLGSLFGGYKAEGGPLEPGKWHIAGEHGPEPVWGGGPGAFAAGYGRGGDVNIVYKIDARNSTQESVGSLAEFLKRHAASIKAEIFYDIQRKKVSLA